jgi:hypothetical protein
VLVSKHKSQHISVQGFTVENGVSNVENQGELVICIFEIIKTQANRAYR